MAGHDRSMHWLARGARLIGLAVLGGTLAGFGLLGRWCAQAARDQSLERQQAAASLERRSAIERRLAELRGRLASIAQECESIRGCLPSGPDEARFIALLAATASENSVQINDFRPGRKVNHGDSLGSLELRVFCEGPYASVCAFLEQTQELERLVHMSSLRMSPTDESGDRVSAEVQMLLLFRRLSPSTIARQDVRHAQ